MHSAEVLPSQFNRHYRDKRLDSRISLQRPADAHYITNNASVPFCRSDPFRAFETHKKNVLYICRNNQQQTGVRSNRGEGDEFILSYSYRERERTRHTPKRDSEGTGVNTEHSFRRENTASQVQCVLGGGGRGAVLYIHALQRRLCFLFPRQITRAICRQVHPVACLSILSHTIWSHRLTILSSTNIRSAIGVCV